MKRSFINAVTDINIPNDFASLKNDNQEDLRFKNSIKHIHLETFGIPD